MRTDHPPQGRPATRILRRIAAFACVVAGVFGLAATAQEATREVPAGERTALVLDFEGAVGPASADYIISGIDRANDEGAALVVIRMDTPGGLDTSMREIIRAILGSSVPVVSYVSPSGARAASAGTFILYASHIAAMAPATNLGAATPVQISGGGLPGTDRPKQPKDREAPADGDTAGKKEAKKDEKKDEAPAPKGATEKKAINDAVAYIRSLAELRGRNAEWAEQAVREGVSLSADEALKRDVIDVVANNMQDLFAKIDGKRVKVGTSQATLTLDTRNLTMERVEPDWRMKFLAAITNPNVALILMMIGIYGLIFEFMNPGALYPGTIGAICLLIGLYALAALPVNYAGAGLIVLGIALMIAEAFAPSFGALGIGGAIAFIVGAAILIDTEAPQFQLAWPVVGGVAAASLGFTLLVVKMFVSSRHRAIVSGSEQIMGAQARVIKWSGNRGHVFVHGERWIAVAEQPLSEGQTVRIVGRDGLTLTVAADDATPN